MPTLKEFGEMVGVSVRTATDLRARGIIPKECQYLHEMVRPYVEHLRETAAGRASGGEFDLTSERARLAHHQANIAALDEEVKKGTLIPAEQVKAKWIDIKSSVRAKLISLPTKVASSCAGKSEVDIESSARDIVYQALEEMARGDVD